MKHLKSYKLFEGIDIVTLRVLDNYCIGRESKFFDTREIKMIESKVNEIGFSIKWGNDPVWDHQADRCDITSNKKKFTYLY